MRACHHQDGDGVGSRICNLDLFFNNNGYHVPYLVIQLNFFPCIISQLLFVVHFLRVC